jgi:integrase
VKILSEEQRLFIDKLKNRIPRGSSLIPAGWTFKQFKNRFYYVCRKHNIKRASCLTVHGLRHTYACRRYIALTSSDPPVLRNQAHHVEDKDKDLKARKRVAEELGHGRITISSTYLGSRRR